jgi:predicted nucleotidyltransferase
MGLGTRAVDRLADDFPVLVAPGQPALRANASPDEMERYSPRWIDVINLEMNRFETLPLREFLREVEHDLPRLSDIVSVLKDGRLIAPGPIGIDCKRDDVFVTFDGLITRTPFVRRLHAILQLLEKTLGYPVDIEFASDGTDFYLLQCRAQSYAEDSAPSPIPGDIAHARILFNAKRYVSNGRVPDATHIVYVDPRGYSQLPDRDTMLAVGRAIGRLNQLLPRRQFILMGPGRWGSRGDIRLGVSVTYSDINNCSMLVEIARRQGNYVPELSFGTHFFQDLVEARIRYLPLYPDDDGITFNEAFLSSADNVLADVAPEYAHLAHTVRVIDVPGSAKGMRLRVLMNADLEEAVGYFDSPSSDRDQPPAMTVDNHRPEEAFWWWRTQVAERLASEMSASRFGVVACYLLGSTKNATAGPNSDIDLLIHFRGTPEQRKELELWLEGWNLSLAEMNYIHTGYKRDRMLDAHIVTDDDIDRKAGLTSKINAVTDAARPLAVR